MTSERCIVIRVSNKEFLRFKRNVGNLSMTVRALLDVHCTGIEKSREYQNQCFRMLEESERELTKLGVGSGKIRINKRVSGGVK